MANAENDKVNEIHNKKLSEEKKANHVEVIKQSYQSIYITEKKSNIIR